MLERENGEGDGVHSWYENCSSRGRKEVMDMPDTVGEGFLKHSSFGEVNARGIRKTPEADLRLYYQKVLEASLIAALLIIIVAFRFLPVYESKVRIKAVVQEVVQVEDIEQTRQENRPPPPPRPAIPVEVPSDEALEDITIGSTEIDITEEVAPPPQEQFDEEQFFVVVEDMPQIIGGSEAIKKNLVYPDLAIRAGVQGKVFVLVYVDEKGYVVKTEVVKGIGAGCDEAAQRAVEKVKFIPGKQRGLPRKVRVMVPVLFQLRGGA